MSKRQPTKAERAAECKRDIERWSAMYPWYKKLVQDVHETLTMREQYRNHKRGDIEPCKTARRDARRSA